MPVIPMPIFVHSSRTMDRFLPLDALKVGCTAETHTKLYCAYYTILYYTILYYTILYTTNTMHIILD